MRNRIREKLLPKFDIFWMAIGRLLKTNRSLAIKKLSSSEQVLRKKSDNIRMGKVEVAVEDDSKKTKNKTKNRAGNDEEASAQMESKRDEDSDENDEDKKPEETDSSDESDDELEKDDAINGDEDDDGADDDDKDDENEQKNAIIYANDNDHD